MACPRSSRCSRSSLIEKKLQEMAATSNRAFSSNEASTLKEEKFSKQIFRGCTVHTLPRSAIFLFLTVAVLLLFGCDRRQQSVMPTVPEVATVTLQPQELLLTTELPGRTSAYLVAEIRPQVNGIIQKRLFTEGSDVKAGQVLYQIDPAPFEAALDSARAALAKSQANLFATRLRFERYKGLLAEKAVSQQDYDDREAALKQAEADIEYCKAAVETARINLGYTRVTAPISGRIGKSNVTDGALVTAYQPLALATIQQLDPIYVDVPQSTSRTAAIEAPHGGQPPSVKTEPTRTWSSLSWKMAQSIRRKGRFSFATSRWIRRPAPWSCGLSFQIPEGVLLPGMFVQAVVKEGKNEQAILVPQQAVSRDPKGNPIALIVDAEGKVQQRMLTLDRAIGDKWLVSSGLASGDSVIVEGMQKVRPGASVKVIPFDPPRKAGAEPGNTAPPAGKAN